jgi:glycine cleavage system regulatory protein
MSTYLVLSVIGDDRPGLVEELSSVISAHQGSWREASMSRLAGKFAGIVEVDVPSTQVGALKAALEAIAALRITAETAGELVELHRPRHLTLSLVGQDRIGIVKEVAQVLARHDVNVEELTTYTSSAPMGSGILFHADADLRAAADLDAQALKADLERLSDELIVDVTLDEIIPV